MIQMVSDKALVKQLQKEVARLEAELRIPDVASPCPLDTEALLHEKNAEIQQVGGWPMGHVSDA